jgi:CheY-like chemotaxis protein/HPt (histidine-containing phosphotransfer) domain-containing protein
MSDKHHGGQSAKTSKDSSKELSKELSGEHFKDGFKSFEDGLRAAEEMLSDVAPLEAQAGELLGESTKVTLAELPKILFKLSQSTTVGAVITSPTGDELMANSAFYKLTSQSGGASGAIVLMHDHKGGNQLTPPWVRAASNSKVIFERLYCKGDDGENDNGRHLDFYCRPLLDENNHFEGAFTLVSDSSEEVSRHDRLRELVGAVEDKISDLKASSEELSLFLKSQPRLTASRSSLTSAVEPNAQSAKSDDEHEGDVKDAFEEESKAEEHEPDEHKSQGHQTEEPKDEDDFDPSQLQEAVESASAFILDQGVSPFPEIEDEGPEELWQEMSEGLAGVLQKEEPKEAPREDFKEGFKEEHKEAVQEAAPQAGAQANADGLANGARCLVVDDIPVNQKLLVFQLKRLGLNIDTASSGHEALDKISHNHYQLIFMDCDMPGMNGFETTSEIRQRFGDSLTKLPIIGMTSHDRDGDKQKCLKAGMDDALHKGVSEQDLRKAVATALGVNESAKVSDGPELERNFEPQELEELIQTFMYAMEIFVSSMQRAIDEKDSDLVRELASSVSGPSRVLGLHDMNKVSQEMVKLSSSGDWPQVRLKYLRLKTVYMRCQDDLRKLCPQAFSQTAAH